MGLSSVTENQALYYVIAAGLPLTNVMEVTPENNGDSITMTDPDIYGKVGVNVKQNFSKIFNVTVKSGSSDETRLRLLRQTGKVGIGFPFSVQDLRSIVSIKSGVCAEAYIMEDPTNGLNDDPVFKIACPLWIEK